MVFRESWARAGAGWYERDRLDWGSAVNRATSRNLVAGDPRFDPYRPHPTRLYAYWLGGKDHFHADRKAAEQVIRARPQVVEGTRANRAFHARVVRYLAARAGIRQFLDVVAGLPAADNTHEVAQHIAPDSRGRVLRNDAVVLTHAQALLVSNPAGACACVDADARDPDAILSQAAAALDFTRPVAVLLLALLHFLPDSDDPAGIVAALAGRLTPGSFAAISHLTGDFAPSRSAPPPPAPTTNSRWRR